MVAQSDTKEEIYSLCLINFFIVTFELHPKVCRKIVSLMIESIPLSKWMYDKVVMPDCLESNTWIKQYELYIQKIFISLESVEDHEKKMVLYETIIKQMLNNFVSIRNNILAKHMLTHSILGRFNSLEELKKYPRE